MRSGRHSPAFDKEKITTDPFLNMRAHLYRIGDAAIGAPVYAARALNQFGDNRLVLIRADSEQGHGVGSNRELVIQEFADVYSFVFNRAGVEAFKEPAH